MSVRLYGRSIGNGSHAVVTRGFKSVLEDSGLLDGFFPIDVIEEEDRPNPGALAEHAVYTGPLNRLKQIDTNTRHAKKWVVVAPNSNHVPNEIVKVLHETKATCLVPSIWAAQQLIHYDLPTLVVPHGVQGFSRVDRSGAIDLYEQERFHVLHLSTSAGQRKGTDKLVQAWLLALRNKLIPEKSVLICILDNDAMSSLRLRLVDEEVLIPESIKLMSRADFSPSQLSALLANASVLCQPSRAEAFGLTPLEALACGVPVVATTCSGHSYLNDMPGVMPVHHGDDGPIDDGPGAVAPTIAADEIANALGSAWRFWGNLNAQAQGNASVVAAEWSWHRQLSEWIQRLQKA